jgi:hypothetical protein
MVELPEIVATRLEPGTRAQLKRLAERGGRSLAGELRLAVREHLLRRHLLSRHPTEGAPK